MRSSSGLLPRCARASCRARSGVTVNRPNSRPAAAATPGLIRTRRCRHAYGARCRDPGRIQSPILSVPSFDTERSRRGHRLAPPIRTDRPAAALAIRSGRIVQHGDWGQSRCVLSALPYGDPESTDGRSGSRLRRRTAGTAWEGAPVRPQRATRPQPLRLVMAAAVECGGASPAPARARIRDRSVRPRRRDGPRRSQ
jgi:hypothetical protein